MFKNSNIHWKSEEDIHYTIVIIIVMMSTLWQTKDYDFINNTGKERLVFKIYILLLQPFPLIESEGPEL